MLITLIPYSFNSVAKGLVSPAIEPLETAYVVVPLYPSKAATEATLIMTVFSSLLF